MHPKHISIEDYSYILPNERIAKFPAKERDHSKLLVVKGKQILEDQFHALSNYLPPHSLLVFNNTQVIYARLHFVKDTGALIEVFCLEPAYCEDFAVALGKKQEVEFNCMIGNLKKWKGQMLEHVFQYNCQEYVLRAEYKEEQVKTHRIKFSWDADLSFSEVLEICGTLPIPPYLHRETESSDLINYQTVYSKIEGSVAAPTAGLHFTSALLDSFARKGLAMEEVTLHVGAGTFQPVKTAQIGEHIMHTERIQVKCATIAHLAAHPHAIIGVGTTSVRTLESLYWMGVKVAKHPDLPMNELHVSQWEPYSDENNETMTRGEALEALVSYLKRRHSSVLYSSTEIIIAPGYLFRVIDGMVTNFHQPQSTLLLLIAAFLEISFKEVYDYALNHQFRFLSYGDSSLLLKSEQ